MSGRPLAGWIAVAGILCGGTLADRRLRRLFTVYNRRIRRLRLPVGTWTVPPGAETVSTLERKGPCPMRSGRDCTIWTAIVLIPVLLMGCGGKSDEVASPSAGAVEEPPQPDAAGETIRELLLALLEKDEERISAVILPNPNASVLWGGPQAAVEQRDVAKKLFANMTFRDLAVGDKVPLPDGRVQEITESEIDDDHRLIVGVFASGDTMPGPFMVSRVGELWKVNASPIIFQRVERLRRMHEEAERRRAQLGPPLPPRPGAPKAPPATDPAEPSAEPPSGPPAGAPQ